MSNDNKWTELRETIQELHDVHKDNPDVELMTRFLLNLMDVLDGKPGEPVREPAPVEENTCYKFFFSGDSLKLIMEYADMVHAPDLAFAILHAVNTALKVTQNAQIASEMPRLDIKMPKRNKKCSFN